jgi:hypothetical protein
MSPTGLSCSARQLRISRRRGSATALKASEVVAARGMSEIIYSYIGICQATAQAAYSGRRLRAGSTAAFNSLPRGWLTVSTEFDVFSRVGKCAHGKPPALLARLPCVTAAQAVVHR